MESEFFGFNSFIHVLLTKENSVFETLRLPNRPRINKVAHFQCVVKIFYSTFILYFSSAAKTIR